MKSTLKEPQTEFPFDIEAFVKRVKLKNKDIVHLKLLISLHVADSGNNIELNNKNMKWLNEFSTLNPTN